MRRAAALLVSWILTFGLAVAQPVLSSSPELNAPIDSAQLAYELSFREKFGLSTDQTYVRSLMSGADAYSLYDVALSASEQAELERRIVIEHSLAPTQHYAERLPNYGGMWIDQRAGGVVKIGFTAEPTKYAAEIAALLPEGASMEVIQVAYGLPYLEDLADQVWAERKDLERDDVNIRHVYPYVKVDRLVVGIEDPTPEKEDYLQSRYGPAVVTEPSNPTPSACTGRESCYGPPLRAGISGAPQGVVYDNRCSLGFLVHNEVYEKVNILTAGHCAKTLLVNWFHAGNGNWPIEKIRETGWPNSQHSDVARIGPLPANLISDWVYRTDTGAHSHVHEIAPGEDIPEQMVCLNGRRGGNGVRCGTLRSIGTMEYRDPTVPGGIVTFTKMRFADYAIKDGDSGGAIHGGYTSMGVWAHGIQSGCTLGYDANDNCLGWGVYSTLGLAMSEVHFGVPCMDLVPC